MKKLITIVAIAFTENTEAQFRQVEKSNSREIGSVKGVTKDYNVYKLLSFSVYIDSIYTIMYDDRTGNKTFEQSIHKVTFKGDSIMIEQIYKAFIVCFTKEKGYNSIQH